MTARPPFHVMLKPSGAQCNLDCTYCFYLPRQEALGQPEAPRMNERVLEAHIRQYIAGQDADAVVFSWQGGEPTLMSLDFFRRVLELQARHARPGQRIENDLQTNGILLNDEWARFLAESGFLVGLSADGPPELHDAMRRARGGAPTAERVARAAELLHRHAVPFHALCVVSRANARRPLDVYRYLRDRLQPRKIQFIPCVERRGAEAQPTEWSLRAEDWGYFLERVWQEWFGRDYGRVFVDAFENVIAQMFGFGAQTCVTSRRCGRALALEHDGALYSCDHFVDAPHRLGSILEEDEAMLVAGARQQAFGAAKEEALTGHCRRCLHLELCWGDCPKHRFARAPDGEPGLSHLCAGLKRFYGVAVAHRAELERRLTRGG